jgi:hypothetical protein
MELNEKRQFVRGARRTRRARAIPSPLSCRVMARLREQMEQSRQRCEAAITESMRVLAESRRVEGR